MATMTNEELSDLSVDVILPIQPPGAASLSSKRSLEEVPVPENSQSYERQDVVSKARGASIIGSVASVNFLNTMGSGILTVALPRMAKDLNLPNELLLWPASIYALTCGCTLLLLGAVADIIGRRKVYLTGCALFSVFTLACGLSKSAAQLIIFRAFLGLAISLCLTTAVGIVSTTFAAGPRRNFAFASLGAVSPVGYSVGLVLGGVFVDGIGWRYGYYIAATANMVVFGAACWGLPPDESSTEGIWIRLIREVDWIGATLASVSLGMLMTVLAMITGSIARLRDVPTIALLVTGVSLIPAFIFWVGRQESLGRPTIIPNSIWKQSAFTTVCICVFLTWASFNAFGYFATLYFQEVQKLPALQTSLRFLPTVVCGVLANLAVGFLLRVVSGNILVIGSSIFSGIGPLLFALAHPEWPYWYALFPAIFLSPTSSDVLYTISNIVVSNAFPPSRQSLAGGVFNTVSQIGNSVGLAITAVIASSVTTSHSSGSSTSQSDSALLKGYQAAFWAELCAFLIVIVTSLIGLRKAGLFGVKVD